MDRRNFSVPVATPGRAPASRWLSVLGGATAVLAGLIAVPAAGGTVSSWIGGAGNGTWSNASNWTTPLNTTNEFDLVFSGTAQGVGPGTTANPRVVTTFNNIGTVNISTIQFINTGTLSAGQNAFFRINGGTLALNSSTISTVTALGGQFATNSDGDTIAASMTLSGTSTVITNNLHNLSLAGAMSGAGGMIYDDGSVNTTEFVYVSGTNTYSGGTLIRGGFVQTGARVDPATALATTSNNFAFGSGPVTVSDNGTLLLRNSSIISNPLTVSGLGSGTNPANNAALLGSYGVVGQTAEYRGDITLAGPVRFSVASSASGDTTSKLLVSGNVNLGSHLLTLRSRRQGTQTTGLLIEITGTMSGSGGVDVVGEVAGSRVLISGSNSYSGGTTVTTGTLIVGNGKALGDGFLAVNTSGLNLNGQTLRVGALSGSSAGVISTGTSGAARLVTTSTTNSTYAGTIQNGTGTVGLTKAGPGVLSLTGTNTHSGSTDIDGGVLAVDSAGAIGGGGDITFGGGTLRYSAANQVDYSTQFKDSDGAIWIDTNGQTVTFAAAIAATNLGGLTKSGSGTLALNGVNQFTGTTSVAAGTLTGTGSVLGPLTVAAGAVFDPGASPSATTIFGVGGFAQAAGGTTRMQVNGVTAGSLYDQVLFSGTATTVSWGGTLDLTLSGSYVNYTAFNLFSGFASQTGSLAGISFAASAPYAGLAFNGPTAGIWKTGRNASGQYFTFDQSTGVLAVIPEPGAVTLGILGAGSCMVHRLVRRRRRTADG